MNTRRFALGFAGIFLILSVFAWLEITTRRSQREIEVIYAENTAIAQAVLQTQTAAIAFSATSTSTATATPRREFATLTPSPTATISGTITGTQTTPTLFPTIPITSGLPTPSPTVAISQTATATLSPTPTIETTPTEGPTATDTPKPTFTPFPQAFNINGRVLLDGNPIEDVAISLERVRVGRTDILTTTMTAADGTFAFPEVFPSGQGFNIVFQNEDNQGFADDEVMAWAWLGLIEYSGDEEVDLPDMEIGLGTFEFEEPAPGSDESIGDISSSSPLEFDWTPYSADEDLEIEYWVDLLEDTEEQEPVWQSLFDTASSMEWDGITEADTKVEPGDYLWGVGAVITLEDGYELTIFSRLASIEFIE